MKAIFAAPVRSGILNISFFLLIIKYFAHDCHSMRAL